MFVIPLNLSDNRNVRYSDFRGGEVKRVPVIRIFGSTPVGQKVCLHIHGVLPYLHVPYDDCTRAKEVCVPFAASLNKALNASMGNADSTNQHIHLVELVYGTPFYGYHDESCLFLRVVYYNPALLNRISQLLLNGAVLGKPFQPHDAHIPFILQFFIDYNLYGMNQIRLSSVRYRRSGETAHTPRSNASGTPKLNQSRADGFVYPETLPDYLLMPAECGKISTCALEVDASSSNILNHRVTNSGQDPSGNPGIAFIWADEKARRSAVKKEDRLTPPGSPSISQVPLPESHLFYYDRLKTELEKHDVNSESRLNPSNTTSGNTLGEEYKLVKQVDSFSVEPIEDLFHLTPSDLSLVNILAHLGDDPDSQKEVAEKLILEEELESLSQRLECDEGAVIEAVTKQSPEEEELAEIEALEMSQAWDTDFISSLNQDLNRSSGSDIRGEKTSEFSDRIEQMDGSVNEPEPSKLYERRPQRKRILHRKSRPKLSRLIRPCFVRLRKLENQEDMRKVCQIHGLNFSRYCEEHVEEEFRNKSDLKRINFMVDCYVVLDKLKIPEGVNDIESPQSSRSSFDELRESAKINEQNIDMKSVDAEHDVPQTIKMAEPLQESTEEASRLGDESESYEIGSFEDEADDDIVNCSQTFVRPKLWPLRRRDSHIVSFYDFKSPVATSVPRATFSSSTEKNIEDEEEKSVTCESVPSSPSEIPTENENSTVCAGQTPRRNSPTGPPNLHSFASGNYCANNIWPSNVSATNHSILRPFARPPDRKKFRSFVRNQQPFWSRYEDYQEAGEGKKGKLGVGDLCHVTCVSTSNMEPFNGSSEALQETRMQLYVKRELINETCLKALSGDWWLMTTQVPGKVFLTPVRQPPKRSSFLKAREALTGDTPKPITSTPFGKTQSNENKTPLSRSGIPAITPIPPKDTEKRVCRRELIKKRTSQISGTTPDKTFVYKVNHGCLEEVKAEIEPDYLTIVSLEVLTSARGNLTPDPTYDSIGAAFYYISHDVMPSSDIASGKQNVLGVFVVTEGEEFEWELKNLCSIRGIRLGFVRSEMELLNAIVDLVQIWDPDILLGFEVQQLSWGYLIERADALGFVLPPKLSRVPSEEKTSHANEDLDPYGSAHTSEIHLCGRITLNVWRLFRHEIALTSYTFENLYFHVLHERLPRFSFGTLYEWWNGGKRETVLRYFVKRVEGNWSLLEKMDLIGRTCELARLFGIQFYEVLSRGSQFRVESMMLRLAKPANYVPVSPSVEQRAHMRAPECIPLIMEPESTLYVDPVVVLDFQSLYPSIVIAYNYCFSTCLGRSEFIGQIHPFKFGCTTLRVPAEVISKVGLENITISPCGVAFVKADVRRGILPQMLEEILTTRIMVKQSMKLHSGDRALQKVLDARQLGLKLIANVTYGYTSANFSGRMPCVEIGDSIVSKGRETLEKAIQMVHSNPDWGAKVVYGDTDSMFVLLPGRDKEAAFRIGHEIAAAVTKVNPKPVKLKFEKVYYPCILQTKKRYVGYKYETLEQKSPEYEAKGIETVRRDGVPAVCKILEKTLRLLFETRDISVVKRYIQAQLSKILLGRVNFRDFTFAKEFRGMTGYKPGACVPALELAKKRAIVDPRSVPRVGDRVPYVVVYGPPGVTLIQLVREPGEVLKDQTLRLNGQYYITKVILPPLERCLNMMRGVNVMNWYTSLPKLYRPWCHGVPEGVSGPGASTITQFFVTTACPVCDKPNAALGGEISLCSQCCADPQASTMKLLNKSKYAQKRFHDLNQICKTCCGLITDDIRCASLDCPLLHFRELWKKDQAQLCSIAPILQSFNF
ncbi:unnamed protein product [Notodromas monacha]|uniref:DNA polymerase n=1 Tax=Notodromas monacha TaxID=399045 RepID=A0A7R9GA12_9CRUS|nr:unnamed protein product [Notodromas monacha]CAG0914828.1 unnamed protein product [Notodromas monacha]